MKKQEPTAVICWQSKLTGFMGHGQPISRRVAEHYIKEDAICVYWLVPSNPPR